MIIPTTYRILLYKSQNITLTCIVSQFLFNPTICWALNLHCAKSFVKQLLERCIGYLFILTNLFFSQINIVNPGRWQRLAKNWNTKLIRERKTVSLTQILRQPYRSINYWGDRTREFECRVSNNMHCIDQLRGQFWFKTLGNLKGATDMTPPLGPISFVHQSHLARVQ